MISMYVMPLFNHYNLPHRVAGCALHCVHCMYIHPNKPFHLVQTVPFLLSLTKLLESPVGCLRASGGRGRLYGMFPSHQVEYMVLRLDRETRTARLSLRSPELLDQLQATERQDPG